MSEHAVTEKPNNKKLGYGPISAIVITLAGYLGSQLLAGFWLTLLPLLIGWDEAQAETWLETSVFAQFLAILIVEAAFIWIIWAYLNLVKVKLSQIGLVKPVLKDIGRALAGYAVYFAAFVLITALAQQIAPSIDLEQEQEIGFSTNTTGLSLWVVFVSLVILPPIAEEIVTRGFLYTGLRSKLGVGVSAIITSLIFAAAHLQWGNGAPLLWVAAIDTFTLSLILVYLREKTGSLWPSIFVHMLKNGAAFLVLFIFKAA